MAAATLNLTPLVQEVLATQAPEAFLVEVKQKPGKQTAITVLADTDEGISLEACAKINRSLRALLEERLGPEANFSLEVTSPGLSTPLKLLRQYQKNIGRTLKVVTLAGNSHMGVLQAVDDKAITLEIMKKPGPKQKAQPTPITLSFNDIKAATVEVSFRASA